MRRGDHVQLIKDWISPLCARGLWVTKKSPGWTGVGQEAISTIKRDLLAGIYPF